jgi:ABC-2 type transport system permease protein
VALLYGVVAWAYGLAVAGAGGVRDIGRAIVDGSLDVHLGRPRHPLPSLLFSRSTPSGFGDLLSALVLWLWLGGRGVADLPLLIVLSTAACGVLLATTTIAHSLVFWWPRAVKIGEQVYEVIVMIAVYPQHVFGPSVRLALFTILPVAFISQVPVEAVREASIEKAVAVLVAAALYGALAVLVFDRGLRRYTSGNRMVENR